MNTNLCVSALTSLIKTDIIQYVTRTTELYSLHLQNVFWSTSSRVRYNMIFKVNHATLEDHNTIQCCYIVH